MYLHLTQHNYSFYAPQNSQYLQYSLHTANTSNIPPHSQHLQYSCLSPTTKTPSPLTYPPPPDLFNPTSRPSPVSNCDVSPLPPSSAYPTHRQPPVGWSGGRGHIGGRVGRGARRGSKRRVRLTVPPFPKVHQHAIYWGREELLPVIPSLATKCPPSSTPQTPTQALSARKCGSSSQQVLGTLEQYSLLAKSPRSVTTEALLCKT